MLFFCPGKVALVVLPPVSTYMFNWPGKRNVERERERQAKETDRDRMYHTAHLVSLLLAVV